MGLQISLDMNRVTAGIGEEKREDNLAFKEMELGADKSLAVTFPRPECCF